MKFTSPMDSLILWPTSERRTEYASTTAQERQNHNRNIILQNAGADDAMAVNE